MNLELLHKLDPFAASALPEVREQEPLDFGDALIMKFNRRGTLLAVGCHDGRVVVWDFDTRNVSRNLAGHTHPISCLDWSRNGRYLLSGSSGWTLILWDVLNASIEYRFTFDSAVLTAQLHPRNPEVCIVSPLMDAEFLLNMKTNQKTFLLHSTPSSYSTTLSIRSPTEKGKKKGPLTPPSSSQPSPSSTSSYAIFDKKGEHVMVGDQGGMIKIFDTTTQIEKGRIRVKVGASIKSLQLSRNGKYLLVNSTDKVLRVYTLLPSSSSSSSSLSSPLFSPPTSYAPSPKRSSDGGDSLLNDNNNSNNNNSHGNNSGGGEGNEERWVLEGEFSDSVNKYQWKACCFSCDGDYVIGGSVEKAEHKIYIWNRPDASFVKTLEGPKDGILSLSWHPRRSKIVSCSTSGLVYIWTASYVEHWSAFAPHFKELEENVEYIEREDEFDEIDSDDDNEDENSSFKDDDEDDEDDNESVDIMTVDKMFSSDSEIEDELYYLPVVPDADPISPALSKFSSSLRNNF